MFIKNLENILKIFFFINFDYFLVFNLVLQSSNMSGNSAKISPR